MRQKHLFTVGVMFCALFFDAHAQISPPVHKLLPEKAQLFSNLPEKINVSDLWLHKLFAGPDTGIVKFQLTPTSVFEGVIMQKLQVNPHVVNINVRSSNYDNAMLSVSKITYNDLSVKYIGRIISPRYGDVFLLTRENDALYFKKKKQSVVITE